MIGFIAEYEFVWGFQARIAGLSKTSPSFFYPPPTTFLGALAEVIAKENKIGEEKGGEIISEISKNLCAIGLRALNCVPLKYSDINRILAIKITVGKRKKETLYPNPVDIPASFDSPARGKTILSSLDDNAPTIRWFLVFKNKQIEFKNNKIDLNEDLFWKIHRIGSKESRVSAVNVGKYDVGIGESEILTTYSFPIDPSVKEVEESDPKWEFEVYVNPYVPKDKDIISSYFSGNKVLSFRIPIVRDPKTTPTFKIKLLGEYVAYTVGEEKVIGCRR